MAHNISKVSGRREMFYVGETPWHGLGTKLDKPATSREAIEAAGLDYGVEARPVYMLKADGTPYEIERNRAIVRTDVEIPLGVVGTSYAPIQNVDAFEFFDSIVGSDKAIYHTAGALGRGERVWILAKLPGEIRIEKDPDDVTEKYLLFMNSHDGTTACRMLFTPVRVVCQNTLNAALSNEVGISIRHVGDVQSKVEEARKALGIADEHYKAFEAEANWLAGIEITPIMLAEYLGKIYPEPKGEDATPRTRNRIERIHGDITSRFEAERGRSLWHLANAAVEYVDHGQNFRGASRTDKIESRFKNVLMGAGAERKAVAFDSARELVSALTI